MTLYESNYIRLRRSWATSARHVGEHVSRCAGDCDLHLDVVEHAPLHVDRAAHVPCSRTQAGTVADPDLELRVYHDARLAEVSACGRWIDASEPRARPRRHLRGSSASAGCAT